MPIDWNEFKHVVDAATGLKVCFQIVAEQETDHISKQLILATGTSIQLLIGGLIDALKSRERDDLRCDICNELVVHCECRFRPRTK